MPIKLILYKADQSHPLETALRRAAGRRSRVPLEERSGRGRAIVPCLSIAVDEAENIHYAAAPEERESAPFDAVLDLLETAKSAPPRLNTASRPAALKVFISPACPHCPKVAEAATRLAVADPGVDVTIIDVHHFADLAAVHGIQSVPTTILDDELRISGMVTAQALLEAVASRGTAEYRERRFLQHIESGRFAAAAADMQKEGQEVFLSLWRRSTTATRVGLMMIIEFILERSPRGLDALASELLPVLKSPDPALRGDTVDVLGRIGHPVAAEAVAALIADENPDVAEIARQVWKEMNEREN